MTREKNLLDRLREASSLKPLMKDEDPELIAESVLKHLSKMLNTRQGHTLTQPEYGIPDFTEVVTSMPEGAVRLEKAIEKSIELFEPRLRNVRVVFKDDEDDRLSLHFDVIAELVTQEDQYSLKFDTKINADGKLEVTG